MHDVRLMGYEEVWFTSDVSGFHQIAIVVYMQTLYAKQNPNHDNHGEIPALATPMSEVLESTVCSILDDGFAEILSLQHAHETLGVLLKGRF